MPILPQDPFGKGLVYCGIIIAVGSAIISAAVTAGVCYMVTR